MDEDIKKEETYAADEPDTEEISADSENEEIGNIKISVEVISTIAGMAASEIDGVNCMYSSFAGGIAEMFGAKKGMGKGVRVEMTENSVLIDLYVVVDYGVRIPELAWEIQENVKNNVETMTGMNVEKVNIHIEGVSFAKETGVSEENAELPEPENQEIPAESEDIDD